MVCHTTHVVSTGSPPGMERVIDRLWAKQSAPREWILCRAKHFEKAIDKSINHLGIHMTKKPRGTSPRVASQAGRDLRDPKTPKRDRAPIAAALAETRRKPRK